MNRAKEMNDNAFIESFFHQFKTERLKGHAVHSEEELRAIISKYMCYYNYELSHSSTGYISPDEFECRILN
ncbi:MAG: integrase core domain-containing protein [Gammaproteobacteria bacterium]|nr:integrase core domain-containing protein [Gammaproteobacteria bacterium]